MPPLIRSHHLWAAAWFMSVLIFAPQTLKDNYLIFVLLSGAFLIAVLFNSLYVDVNDWNKGQAKTEFYMLMVAISLSAYFRHSSDYGGLAILLKWTMIFIAITAVMSIYSSYVDPEYARKLLNAEFLTDTDTEDLRRFGGGSVGFGGALLILFPMIVYFYRNSSKCPFSKLQILSFGILSFVTLLMMQFFAFIILVVLVSSFAITGRKNLKRSLLIYTPIIILLSIIPTEYYSNFIIGISNYYPHGSDTQFKLIDLAKFLEYGGYEGSTGSRAERYPILFQGLLSNPLLGAFNAVNNEYKAEGAHLYWMNKLTVYGILGFIPFSLIFYWYIKRVRKMVDSEFGFYFLLSVSTGIVLGFMKVLAGREFWYMFFFILPGFYYLPLAKREKQPKDNIIKPQN
jgi:hypothetical protein